MAAENRLTAEQLAALSPGDVVTIECAPDLGRTRLMTGTVVRVGPAELFVSVKGRGGGKFLERYSRRNGARTSSGGGRAELVHVDAEDRAVQDMLRKRTQQIDVLYRQWTRRRADLESLQRLHEAIAEYLEGAVTPQ